MILLDDTFNRLMNAFGILFAIGIPVVIVFLVIVLIAQKSTGGRSMLYKSIVENGYDHSYTIGALKYVVNNILSKEGFNYTNLSIGHEVGNRYNGDFFCNNDGRWHEITIITDGNIVDYRIDNGSTRRFKK